MGSSQKEASNSNNNGNQGQNTNNNQQGNNNANDNGKNDSSSVSRNAEKKDTVQILLTLKDKQGKISIKFYDNGTFDAKMENGTIERGTYKFENGKLTLVSGGRTMTINEDNTFTYISSHDPEKTYEFKIEASDLAKLPRK